jgi:predicted DNA-binding transcriptional regulator AlpA
MSDKSTETALAQILAAIEALPAKLSPGALDNLSPELGRSRIVDNSGACEFLGVSPAHLRRLRAAGKVPPPIKIGTQKLGWRLGTLIDLIDSREQQASAPEPRRDPRHVLTSEPARA